VPARRDFQQQSAHETMTLHPGTLFWTASWQLAAGSRSQEHQFGAEQTDRFNVTANFASHSAVGWRKGMA
jgi:hypothetical protein